MSPNSERIEIACELAFNDCVPIAKERGIQIFKDDTADVLEYTEEFQIIFDERYDYYLNLN